MSARVERRRDEAALSSWAGSRTARLGAFAGPFGSFRRGSHGGVDTLDSFEGHLRVFALYFFP